MDKPTEYPALYHVLREASISRESALAVCGSLDSLGLPWLNSNTAGSALLQWRREGINRRLARIRMLCKDLLQDANDRRNDVQDLQDVHPEQLTILDFLEQIGELCGDKKHGHT